MCILSWVRLILKCFGIRFGEVEILCDLIYCMFSACMQSQQQAELEYQRESPKGKAMSDF